MFKAIQNLVILIIIYYICLKMNNTVYKIRRKRNEMQYSQEYMATKLGISQPAYANLENGETKINIKRLEKIAEILETEIADLLDGNTTINNFNNNAENMKGIGIVENLYQDNKDYTDKIIKQLEADKEYLMAENKRLLSILEKINK